MIQIYKNEQQQQPQKKWQNKNENLVKNCKLNCLQLNKKNYTLNPYWIKCEMIIKIQN